MRDRFGPNLPVSLQSPRCCFSSNSGLLKEINFDQIIWPLTVYHNCFDFSTEKWNDQENFKALLHEPDRCRQNIFLGGMQYGAEGNRNIMELPSSSRWQADVHRTSAFKTFDFPLDQKKRPPLGWSFLLVELTLLYTSVRKLDIFDIEGQDGIFRLSTEVEYNLYLIIIDVGGD